VESGEGIERGGMRPLRTGRNYVESGEGIERRYSQKRRATPGHSLWNPVKELKDDAIIADRTLGLGDVESGEGIES